MDRSILYERINKRVDLMIDAGLIKEVENLIKNMMKFQQQYKDQDIKKQLHILIINIQRKK